MKKTFLFLAIFATIFSACSGNKTADTKEVDPKQLIDSAAVACVRANLKCPSTMNVISVSQDKREEQVMIDTIYHVKSRKGKYTTIGNEKFWDKVTSVTVDAMKIEVRKLPAHTQCLVTYDAQNSFGAMVREETTVAVLENGAAILFDTFFRVNYEKVETSECAIEKTTFKIKNDPLYYLDNGDWFRTDAFDR